MALYYKWDVKNDFAYVLQFFSLISDSLGGVVSVQTNSPNEVAIFRWLFTLTMLTYEVTDYFIKRR